MEFSPTLIQEGKVDYYRGVVQQYIAALNGKDLDGIMSVFAEDAEVWDPIFKRNFRGKEKLREFYAGVITRARLEIVGPIRGTFGNVVATPIRAHIPGSEIDVVTLTTFNDEGLVSNYLAYWGPTDVHPTGDEDPAEAAMRIATR